MFFVEGADRVLRETTLQPGDRVRVRPRIRKFFIWRPMSFGTGFGWWIFRRFRRATRLWVPDGQGGHRQWLDLPPDTGKGDDLHRIMALYGRDNFISPEIFEWREEEPAFAVDGRFDFVAMPQKASRFTS